MSDPTFSPFFDGGPLERHPRWKARQKDRILHYIQDHSADLVPIFSYDAQCALGLSIFEITKLVKELEDELQILLVSRVPEDVDMPYSDPLQRAFFERFASQVFATTRPRAARYLDVELVDDGWRDR